jgi:hypothetical protein
MQAMRAANLPESRILAMLRQRILDCARDGWAISGKGVVVIRAVSRDYELRYQPLRIAIGGLVDQHSVFGWHYQRHDFRKETLCLVDSADCKSLIWVSR